MDSQGKKAGKGPLISEEVSATLGVSQDQYLFQPISVSKECLTPWDVQSRRIYPAEGTWPALYAGEGGGRGYVINLNKDDVQSKQILDPKGIAPPIYAGESRGGGGEMYVIENHPNDSRVSLDDSGKVQTLTGRMGTGGGNTPMILEPKIYGISSYSSNSMKSDNPDSGIYEAKTSRTLDLNGGNPACNQGGMIVCMATQQGGAEIMVDDRCPTITASAGMSGNNQPVICLEGNGARPSHRGDGYIESDKMYTLNTIERHGVCYSIGNGQVHDAMSPSKEVCKTLNCMDDPMKIMIIKEEDTER